MSGQPDYAWGTTCELVPVPGLDTRHRPGWYLVSEEANRVECGPFSDAATAERAAAWMEEHGYGVFPSPWVPYKSRNGLLIGSRMRPPRDRKPAA